LLHTIASQSQTAKPAYCRVLDQQGTMLGPMPCPENVDHTPTISGDADDTTDATEGVVDIQTEKAQPKKLWFAQRVIEAAKPVAAPGKYVSCDLPPIIFVHL
jgi:hypothetical protein